MNLLILASVLIFALVVTIGIKKSNKEFEKSSDEFWDKEYKSNFVRKKSLDNLDYISIPDDFLNYEYDLTNSRVCDARDSLIALKDSKIVNFSGISNTDLKLEYGTANITVLSEYDANYTSLVRSLHILAEEQYNKGCISEATSLLEFSVNTGTDISSTYKLLGNIYAGDNNTEALDELIEKADSINGLMKSAIIEYLSNLKSDNT